MRRTGERIGFIGSLRLSNVHVGLIMSIAFWFVLFTPPASGQNVTVRLIDAKSGKPLSNVPVAMFAYDGTLMSNPQKKPPYPGHNESSVTDAEGKAVFRLPQPHTEHIGFSIVSPAVDFAGCWRLPDLSPDAVLQSGVVSGYDEAKCGKLRTHISAQPGEVVIYEKRLTFWQKLRRELP